MSDLTDNIAAEHVPTYWRSFANDVDIIRCCGKDFGPHPTRKMKRGDEDKAKRDYAAHVAEVTEAAVRTQIATDIKAEATSGRGWLYEPHPYWLNGMADAAWIARGETS